MSDAMPTVLVVGAGPAGLTAAYRLKQYGYDVKVFEKNSEPGGAMRTIRANGFLHETGPNTIMETSPRVTELVSDLGLDGEKVYADDSSGIRYVVKNRVMQALPTGPKDFLTSPLFSKKTLIDLIKEIFKPAWDNRYEENLEQFVLRRLNHEFLDYAINPFVAGVFAGSPDRVSVKHGFGKLYQLEQEYGSMIKGQILGAKKRKKNKEKSKQTAKMFSFRNGLAALIEALVRQLDTAPEYGREIRKIQKDGDGRYHITDQDGHQHTGDGLLYCGTAHSLAGIDVEGIPEKAFVPLEKIVHPAVTVLTLGFRREDIGHSLKGFGVLIPEVEKFNILGALFNSTLFPGRAPEDTVLLTLFIGGMRQPEKAVLADDELVKMSLEDLNTLVEVKGDPVYTHIMRWDKAIPQYEVGYGANKELLTALEAENPGLWFAGNYRNGISAADTIVNATETAEKIHDFFSKGGQNA